MRLWYSNEPKLVEVFKKLKPFIKFLILVSLVISLTGCAGGETRDSKTLTVWHWMSDREQALNDLAKKFETDTGFKVKFELYAPSEIYSQRIKASAQTNTLPDIYGVLGEKRDFASYINSGYVADLSSDLAQSTGSLSETAPAWQDTFFQKALAVNEFLPDNEYGVKPGIYGIPIDVTTIQMVYNKKLYAKAGLDPEAPPATWSDFVAHSRRLKEKNIPRFVSGFGEIWMIEALASNYAMNLMGEEKVFETYQGKVPYTDPDWIRILSLFKEIRDQKILVEGAVTMVNKTAEQTFANERAAVAFNGSWCVNVYKGMNPGLEYGVFLPPKLEVSRPMKIWGGAGSSFVVNARSPRRDAAIRFLKWLTAEEQQAALSDQTENLPSNKNSLKKIAPVLSEFADDMDNAVHPNTYPVHEIPAVAEAFDKGIQSILIGEKTPEEVAEEVQRIKQKEMAKKSAHGLP